MSVNHTVIVAGGSGRRFGGSRRKQFMLLGDQEILGHSSTTFHQHPGIAGVTLVVPPGDEAAIQRRYPWAQIVTGGESRQASVIAGVAACPVETTHVLIHDAARPLVTNAIIDACLAALDDHDVVAPVLRPSDTLIQLTEDGFSPLDRDQVRQMQTPQCFRLGLIQDALRIGAGETDEISLVRRVFPQVGIHFVKGAACNLKITTEMDLAIAALYLESR